MKPLSSLVLGIVAASSGLVLPSSATILALDDFAYDPTQPTVNELSGRNGGSGTPGWSGGWTATTTSTALLTPGLTHPDVTSTGNKVEMGGVAINANNVARRNFSSSLNQSSLFVSFLFTQTGGTIDADDQAYVWLGGSGLQGGATANTFARLGAVGGDSTPLGVSAWTGGLGGTFAENSGAAMASGTTYLFLARLVKVGDTSATGAWDRIEYWINPQLTPTCDLENPLGSAQVDGTLTSLPSIGFSGRNLEASDRFEIDRLMVFDNIADLGLPECAQPIPEAGTVGGAAGLLLIGSRWYLKRTRRNAIPA